MSRGKDELNLDSKLAFGKYEGKSIRQVFDEDEQYIVWAAETIDSFKLEGEAKRLLDEAERRLKRSNARAEIELRSFVEQFKRPDRSERKERIFIEQFKKLDQSERKGKIDWFGPADYYLNVVDCWVKFGITSKWENRKYFYQEQFKNIEWEVVQRVEYPSRWQAEFLEQMVVHQLRPFVTPDTHEWVEHLRTEIVWACVLQTKAKIEEVGWSKYEYIHRHGDNRWEFYKDVAMYEFNGHSESDIHLYDDREPENDDGF